MAILQAVERPVLDVAYAQAARVAELGLAGHRHARALAAASGPASGARSRRRGPFAVLALRPPSRAGRACAWPCPAGAGARLAARRVRRVRARAAVPRPPDRRGRAPALDPRIGRDRERAWRSSAMRSRPWPCPNGAAARLARRPRWSPTGRGARPCSTAPRRGWGSMSRPARCPMPTPMATVIARRRSKVSPPSARSAFGGEQLLLQNRGLFDLLEARAEAREPTELNLRRACRRAALP